MEESKRNLEIILQLLDDVGMTWLTDEVRQYRYGERDPIVSLEVVEGSRRSYVANRGESPFGPIEPTTPDTATAHCSERACIEFVALRIRALAEQLEQANQDAQELGLAHLQLGLERASERGSSDSITALRDLAGLIQMEMLT